MAVQPYEAFLTPLRFSFLILAKKKRRAKDENMVARFPWRREYFFLAVILPPACHTLGTWPEC
jgi:hypothetical protein